MEAKKLQQLLLIKKKRNGRHRAVLGLNQFYNPSRHMLKGSPPLGLGMFLDQIPFLLPESNLLVHNPLNLLAPPLGFPSLVVRNVCGSHFDFYTQNIRSPETLRLFELLQPLFIQADSPFASMCSVAQLCTTLCDPKDTPGSSVRGTLQARIPEQVALSFSICQYNGL